MKYIVSFLFAPVTVLGFVAGLFYFSFMLGVGGAAWLLIKLWEIIKNVR